jgi:hypothetical protein
MRTERDRRMQLRGWDGGPGGPWQPVLWFTILRSLAPSPEEVTFSAPSATPRTEMSHPLHSSTLLLGLFLLEVGIPLPPSAQQRETGAPATDTLPRHPHTEAAPPGAPMRSRPGNPNEGAVSMVPHPAFLERCA